MPKLWPKHAEVMQESFGSKVGVKWDSLGVKLTNWGVWGKGKNSGNRDYIEPIYEIYKHSY